MIHQVRVIFGDTDQMGVVYYANYLRYFEASRGAYLRELGHSYTEIEKWGVALPVAEVHCRYRRPARYEDLLDIHVDITEVGGASLRFEYEVRRDDELLAEGYTLHATVDPNGRILRMPKPLRELVESAKRP
jgi:acyl-CoA thioester hydrolase